MVNLLSILECYMETGIQFALDSSVTGVIGMLVCLGLEHALMRCTAITAGYISVVPVPHAPCQIPLCYHVALC